MKLSTIKVVIQWRAWGRACARTLEQAQAAGERGGQNRAGSPDRYVRHLPPSIAIELIAIVGYLGEQIEDHIRCNYPGLKSHFVVQENPIGQSHAHQLAEQYLSGPMLVVFADTLIETDLSILENENGRAMTWVHPVPARDASALPTGRNGWVSA